MTGAAISSPLTKSARCLSAAVIAGILGFSGLLFMFDPAGSRFYPPCPFRLVTGLYCPGCGSLRAVHQLLHGNIIAAAGLNPLVVASLPFFAYAAARWCIWAIRGRGRRYVSIPAVWIWGMLAIIILFWILRNIRLFPFTLLAP